MGGHPVTPKSKFFFYSPLMGFPKDLEGMERGVPQ